MGLCTTGFHLATTRRPDTLEKVSRFDLSQQEHALSAIRIRRKLDSETLHLPELRPLVGQTVEIVVSPEPVPQFVPGTGDWPAMKKCVDELKDYDFDAWRHLRDFELQHPDAHAP